MERAVLPWVLLYAGLCPAPLIFLFDLQSAYKETAVGLWGFVFIRELRCSLVVSFGFFHEEYLIALVDFIVALRRTKGRGRRTLRSPPSPSSGLHLIHPGDPLRRGISAAAGLQGYRQLVSGASRYSPVPNMVWVLCVRAMVARVSENHVGHWVFRFSLVVGWTVRSCGYVRFWHNLSLGSPLTATFFPISYSASPFHQCCRVEEYRKKRVRAAETLRKQVSHTV